MFGVKGIHTMVFRQTKKPTRLSFQILIYILIATVMSSCLYCTMRHFSEVYITSVHPNRNTIHQRVDSLQTYIAEKRLLSSPLINSMTGLNNIHIRFFISTMIRNCCIPTILRWKYAHLIHAMMHHIHFKHLVSM